ncbi:RNA pseudouridine synthase [Suicoccus acidiformans]|uniref:Pseudouridine synthase n=1 Tax=Suicoccus acidiformans TaxID=2036206 RepID=A0A347WJ84_9LACT|nr:RluA family pseudouridine synthase [Suicoccus acidiformans]AXY25141.1 RNA pseudouridine synthase [Suicoccus acidiformans]
MKFDWIYQGAGQKTVKEFLRQEHLPRRFIARLKYHGGDIQRNGESVTVRALLKPGDQVSIIAPDEVGHDTVIPSYEPIEIVYEDRDILVINKPDGLLSIPSRANPNQTVANRVKGYYVRKGYADQVIHIVTRLDRNTTGLMLIAKHRLAHALLDQQLQAKAVQRYYQALSSQAGYWPDQGLIEAPIARDEDSIITRRVHVSGQYAATEWWIQARYGQAALVKLQLHTGRTHQIRVHMAHQGSPLIGDDLYGGPLSPWIHRQALHCNELKFQQPFTQAEIHLLQPLPEDMLNWIKANQKEDMRYGNL